MLIVYAFMKTGIVCHQYTPGVLVISCNQTLYYIQFGAAARAATATVASCANTLFTLVDCCWLVGQMDGRKNGGKFFIGKVHLFLDQSSSYSVNELNNLVEYQCCLCANVHTAYTRESNTPYDIAPIVLIVLSGWLNKFVVHAISRDNDAIRCIFSFASSLSLIRVFP